MKRTGLAELPLHYGHAPPWLFKRMVKLSGRIVEALIDEYGHQEVLRRLADPHWFQALSCVLGYDWHSSGTTTVTCATLKTALRPEEHGIAIAGGKGRFSRRTPEEIEAIGKVFRWSDEQKGTLKYASRMSAKIDNTAIQAGYTLYHHAFVMDDDGRWAVIQQGMNEEDRTARRYHWLSDHVKNFVVEPHDAIVCDVLRKDVLDMTARESEGGRRVSVDLVNDGPERVRRSILSLRSREQRTLCDWIEGGASDEGCSAGFLSMPWNINWEALKRAYELRPRNYEELLGVRGVGPSTVRGLALVSELIYGEKPSWKDPVRYSFCVGGKDGVPFPVDRRAYDEVIEFMGKAVDRAKIGDKEKIDAIKRLSIFFESK